MKELDIINVIKRNNKGVVDIDSFRKFVYKTIADMSEEHDKDSFNKTIEFYVLYYLSLQDLHSFDVNSLYCIIEYTKKCIFSNWKYRMEVNNKTKRDVLTSLMYEVLDIYYDEFFKKIYTTSEHFSKVADEISYVESGRLPEVALENIPEKEYEQALNDTYKIVFENKLN